MLFSVSYVSLTMLNTILVIVQMHYILLSLPLMQVLDFLLLVNIRLQ